MSRYRIEPSKIEEDINRRFFQAIDALKEKKS
jgi:hypothetical protein